MWRLGFRALASRSAGHPVRCYAARPKKKVKGKEKKMEDDTFYVLRKGRMVAIYKTLAECQAQVSSSVADPAVGVYKSNSLNKDAMEYLTSRGLTNPLYCIDVADWKEDLLGSLLPCPFQQPDGQSYSTEATKDTSMLKRSKMMLEDIHDLEQDARLLDSSKVSNKQPKLSSKLEECTFDSPIITSGQSRGAMPACIIEFDGACKGNPGKSGAGVVVRKEDGTVISWLREGLGQVTNNVAEYRALILGMKFALKRGFQKILVQGDSKLVCMQLEGLWKTKDPKMIELFKEAKELKDKFLSFKICHTLRDFNSDADHQANLAVSLPLGEVQEVSGDLI